MRMRPAQPPPHPLHLFLRAACKVLIAACLLLLAGTVQFAPRTVLGSGGGTISGRLVDADNNPLGDIQALLFRENGDGVWDNGDFVAYVDRTPDTGLFVFSGLEPGDYRLTFTDPAGNFEPFAYPDQPDLLSGTTVPISEDGSRDLLDIFLSPAARLGGIVTQLGEPPNSGIALSSIQVDVFVAQEGEPLVWEPRAMTSTNDSGAYTIGGLRAGRYRVQFTELQSSPRVVGEYFDNADSLANATDLMLEAAEIRTDINAELEPLAAITGTVTLTDGSALPDIYACLRPAEAAAPPSGLWQVTDCLAYGLSGADGVYKVVGLPAGSYHMVFFDPHWPPRFFDQAFDQQPSAAQATVIALGAGEPRGNVNATLRPAGYIAGTAKAPDSSVLENVDVRLYRRTGDDWWWFQSARTNEAGLYTFQTVISDTYRVGFFDPLGRYAPEYHAGLETFDDATDFWVPYGAHVPNIDGVLLPGGAVTGTVIAGNAALAGAEVSLFARGTEWLTQTTTDAFGAFAFSGLGLETHTVYARDTAGVYTPASSAPFTVTAGGILSLPEIELLPAPTLVATTPVTTTGHVSTTEGTPVAGAVVTLYKAPGLRARVFDWDAEPFTCPSAASLADPPLWDTAASAVGAVFAYPAAEGLDAAVNPQLTDASGAFGWVLPPGCWFVRVEAGYASGVSALAGAPPRIADLNVLLPPPPTPTPTLTPMPTSTPTRTPSATSTATPTRTVAPTATRTPLPNPTVIGMATAAPTATATSTPTPSVTATSTATATPTPIPSTPTPGGGSTPDALTPTPDMRVLLPVVQK